MSARILLFIVLRLHLSLLDIIGDDETRLLLAETEPPVRAELTVVNARGAAPDPVRIRPANADEAVAATAHDAAAQAA